MLFRIFAAFVTLRALYAVGLMLVAMNHATGLLPQYALSGQFGQLIDLLPAPVLIGWAAYTTGYLVASARFWFKRSDAPLIYAGAFMVDLLMWAYSSLSPIYQSIVDGRAGQIDIVFNIIDLVILSGMWFYFQRRE